jgi:hypothetical protein
MNTLRTFDEEDQQTAIDWVRDMLPEDVDLAMLSFTGGRAFGWGGENTDIDLRGFVAKEDWFNTLHGNPKMFDINLVNIESIEEPDIRYYRWKQYYDCSNPIYIHEDFDYYEDFIDHCEVEHIHHIYPYDLEVQIGRMDADFNARNSLHTYKEIMIPLYYIYTGEIESDVTQINEHEKFGLDGLMQCVENYGPYGGQAKNIDEALVREEIDELAETLGDELPEYEGDRPKVVRS